MLNSNGQGRRVLNLPQNAYVTNFGKALSPNGKWLVLYQGKPSKYSDLELTTDLSINLFYIPDGSIYRITNLFPQNTASLLNWGDYGNIMAFEWSPNGRFLAFASAMDSQLSELYVYDIETKIIRRLTYDSANIWLINWSPDSNWIWFESTEIIAPGDLISFYLMKFDESKSNEPTLLFKSLWTEGKWISPNYYFLISTSEGGACPISNYRYYNVKTTEKTVLWTRQSSAFALDEKNKLLAVTTECDEWGTFVVDWYGKVYMKISQYPIEIEPWNGKKFSFIGNDNYREKVYGINQNGSKTPLSDKYFTSASESPDGHWFVLYADKHYSDIDVAGMDLFPENNEYLRTLTTDLVYPVAWTPDSTGLFFIESNLYYIAIPDGNPVLIDDCKPDGCNKQFVWIP